MAPPAAKKIPVTTKHYIMAALTATLAAAVVVTIVVVVLSPARIVFSITNARYLEPSMTNTTGGDADNEGMMQLTLTVAANNTSGRTRVEYRSIFIDVSNSTEPPWDNWIRTTVKPHIPLFQATRNVTIIDSVVSLAGSLWEDAIDNETSFRVMITALARFRAGITPSRLYEIKVSCSPVIFLPVEAHKWSGGASLPLECGSS